MTSSYPIVRPSSEQLVDLHVYLVPREAWNEKYRSLYNESISEAQSAGFVRVWPELTVYGLRTVIEEQLGYEVIPHNFVFLRSVGRCLTQIKPKQELDLKCKAFLPPAAWSPEIFVLPDPNREGLGVPTYQSFPGYSPRHDATQPMNGMPKQLHQPSNHDRTESQDGASPLVQSHMANPFKSVDGVPGKSSRPDAYTNNTNEDSGIAEPTPEDYPQDFDRRRTDLDEQYYEDESHREEEGVDRMEEMRREAERQQRQEQEWQEQRRQQEEREIEEERQRQAEIMKREEEARRIQEERKRLEEQRREEERREEMRREEERKEEERREEEIRERRRQEEEMRMEEARKQEEMKRRYEEERQRRMEEKRNEEARRQAEKKEQEEIERMFEEERQRKIEERRKEEKARERARQEELMQTVEQEAEDMETNPANLRPDQMDTLMRRTAEEELRDYEPQSSWPQEQQESGRRSGFPQPSTAEDQMELASQEEVRDGLKRVHLTPEVHRKAKVGKVAQKTVKQDVYETDTEMAGYIAQLEALREERMEKEKARQALIKRAKNIQVKTIDRRYKESQHRPISNPDPETNPRDYWKKRYFDEKKRTTPLEEQVNKLKTEMEVMHRKLLSHLEGKRGKGGAKVKGPPSKKNDHKITIIKMQHELEELKRKVDNAKMKLTSEVKLRNQAEAEVRSLKNDVTQKKINLTLTRKQQLAALKQTSDKVMSKTPIPAVGRTSISTTTRH